MVSKLWAGSQIFLWVIVKKFFFSESNNKIWSDIYWFFSPQDPFSTILATVPVFIYESPFTRLTRLHFLDLGISYLPGSVISIKAQPFAWMTGKKNFLISSDLNTEKYKFELPQPSYACKYENEACRKRREQRVGE